MAAVVGLWGISSEVLPALAVLEDIPLWTYTGTLDGQEHVIPVTLADIGLTLLITIIAAVAVRNLPAFLEIVLLQRIAISAGSCYTIKILTGYIIVISAAFTIFSTFGLSWSQIQWLVAALGVGIGFGLQEIVANFISGLIILFERPVQVGDIVTIGNTTGVVSQIRICATIVRSWDQQGVDHRAAAQLDSVRSDEPHRYCDGDGLCNRCPTSFGTLAPGRRGE